MFYKRLHSVSTQFFIYFIIGLIAPVLIGGYLSYYKSARLIEDQVGLVAEQTIAQVKDKIDLIFKKLDDKSMMIMYNRDIHQILEQDGEARNELERVKAIEDGMRFISAVMVNSPELLDIYVFDHQMNHSIFTSDNLSVVDQWRTDWYRTIVEHDGEGVWFGLSPVSYLKGMNMGIPVYGFGRLIKSFIDGEPIGVIFIEVSGFSLMEELRNVQFGDSGFVYVLNQENRYMYHPDHRLFGTETEPLQENDQISKQDGVMVIPQLLDNGWQVIGMVPTDELTTDSVEIRNLTLWIAGCSVLLALLLGYAMTHNIARPLIKLSRLMKRSETGDLTVRAQVRGNNELAHVSHSFNHMLQQIEKLIKQIAEKERQKKIAEIRALRYQINPHFLYNTLNSIRWMAKLKRTDDVANAVTTLVRLLEASLERNGTFVRLGEELSLLTTYMTIQQYRYDFPIQLQIDCPDHLAACEIPRMLLQPLVENAIFHGIAPKEAAGTIKIVVSDHPEDPDYLCISIRDDGVGIPAEILARILQTEGEVYTSRGMTNIGVRHVHQTLQWFFGEESGVVMRSICGEGTTVMIRFCKTRREQHVQGFVS